MHRLEEKVAVTRTGKVREAETNLPGEDCMQGRRRRATRMGLAPLAHEAQEVGGVAMRYQVRNQSEGLG